jgi:phenylacetate-CoA ligase
MANTTGAFHDLQAEKLSANELRGHQRSLLTELLADVMASNRFFQANYKAAKIRVLDAPKLELEALPLITKNDLIEDQRKHPPFGSNRSRPQNIYTRCHQTSGSTGHSLRWLDTPRNWESMLRSWSCIYHAAGVTPKDRICFAFSFGPFLGFWTAFEAGIKYGALCMPTGGMTTVARLRFILDNGITTICCTPTYALRMAEVAAVEKINLVLSPVKRLIVAGEPGGSVPETRARIEAAWGARCIDHYGMTEIGPAAFECEKKSGCLHVFETNYIAECLRPNSKESAASGEVGELVLTNLTRVDAPLIRYRTGDLVRMSRPSPCACGRSFASLEGGILGRADDMLVVRGVNVYPSAIEQLVHRIPGIADYRVEISSIRQMTELKIMIEPTPDEFSPQTLAQKLTAEIECSLGLRVQVDSVEIGKLPRFEMKARRWIQTESTE